MRDQQDVRDVAAVLLVEVTALLGQIHGFAGGDVLEIDDGVGHSALRADDEAFEVDGFFGVGIADLRILGDGKLERVGNRARPFDGAGNGAAVGDGDHFVVGLREGRRGGEEKREETNPRSQSMHTRPLSARRSAIDPPSMKFCTPAFTNPNLRDNAA